jgi:23S rRNA pseudouridine2605 synthase
MPVERIQKILAGAGIASRRASEALIAAGRVTVDGRPATIGESADPATASIAVDGRPIGALGASAAIHLVIHKPAGVTSTVRDRHAERTILDLVPRALFPEGGRLYPVGRLDLDSEGLLLLTNDGAWSERVLHPRFGVEREYAIGLPVRLSPEQVRALAAGMDFDEGRAELFHLRLATGPEIGRLVELLVPPPADLAWYRATLRQGRKRQLRRMFGAVGAPIARLVRVRIGPVRLERLRSGDVRPLSLAEVRALASGGPRDSVSPAGGPRAAGPRAGRYPQRHG